MDTAPADVPDDPSPRSPDAPSPPAAHGATLVVCVTCRLSADEEVRAGRRLFDALVDAGRRGAAPGLDIVPAECLSNCNRACTVAFAGPGRWSYVHGGLGPDSLDDVLTGATRYAATSDGLVPWRERPDILRKGVIARIPPLARS